MGLTQGYNYQEVSILEAACHSEILGKIPASAWSHGELWSINYMSECVQPQDTRTGLSYSWASHWLVPPGGTYIQAFQLFYGQGSSSSLWTGRWRKSQVWTIRSKAHKIWDTYTKPVKEIQGDHGRAPTVSLTRESFGNIYQHKECLSPLTINLTSRNFSYKHTEERAKIFISRVWLSKLWSILHTGLLYSC